MGYLGDTLRDARLAAGYSLRKAASLSLVGDTKGWHLNLIENGKVQPTPDTLIRLHRLYSCGQATAPRSELPAVDAATARRRTLELHAKLTTHLCSDGYATGAIAWSPHWLRRESCSLKGVDE